MPDGGYVMVGNKYQHHGPYAPTQVTLPPFYIRVSAMGLEQSAGSGPTTYTPWTTFPGGPSGLTPASGTNTGVCSSGSNGFAVVGSVEGMNASGNYIGSGHDVIATSDGGLFKIAEDHVSKLNAAGEVEWMRSIASFGQAFSATQRGDGVYVVVGESHSGTASCHGGTDFLAVAFSPVGDPLWQHCYGGFANESAYSAANTGDGGVLIVGDAGWSSGGDVAGHHGGTTDMWLIKIDANGVLVWGKCFGGSDNDQARSIRRAQQGGGFIICGSSNSIDWDTWYVSGNHGGYDVCLVRIDEDGGELWQRSLGGSADDHGYNADQNQLGRYFVAAMTSSTDGDAAGSSSSYAGERGWALGLSADDVGISELGMGGVLISPNPTSDMVVLSFPQNAQPKQLLLLDATGRLVLSQPIANVSGPVTMDLRGHASGVYFVQVRFADGTRAVERVVKE